MIAMYNTMTFSDNFVNYDEFKDEYYKSPFKNSITDKSLELTYYLLYAKYGNNPIANNDTNQFKMKLFSIIFQYGPTWEARLNIQERLRGLSEEDLRAGTKMINNQAANPDSDPTNEELTYINNQSVSKYQKSILDGYNELWQLLKVDVTDGYINQFKNLFKYVVIPEKTLLYTEYEGD